MLAQMPLTNYLVKQPIVFLHNGKVGSLAKRLEADYVGEVLPEKSKMEENVRPPYCYWASELKPKIVTSIELILSSTRVKKSLK